MSGQNNSIKAFYELVRAGLWEKDAYLLHFNDIDFGVIQQLAEEQSVVGLVSAGIEHVVDVKVPQDVALTFVGSTLQLEQQNKAMNGFVAKLIDQLRSQGIYALLVKGQGIAQCYERPLWRACGDVDLLLSNDNYNKAKAYLSPLAISIEKEALQALHLGMMIDSWMVELHGTLRSCCLPQMDNVIDEVQADVFFGGNVRSWNNNRIQVFLPSYDNDVFFVFTHILKHFFRGGIGLRQICDLCRLIWTSREALNNSLLESRVRRAGIITEWKAFASYAVDYLGFPTDAFPLYSPDKKWSRKAKRINDYVLRVGNFGHNRDFSYYSNKTFLVQKFISFCRHTKDGLNHLFIFPFDSIQVWGRIFKNGFAALFKRKLKICLHK